MLLYISLKPYPTDYVDGKLIVNPAKMVLDGYKDTGPCRSDRHKLGILYYDGRRAARSYRGLSMALSEI